MYEAYRVTYPSGRHKVVVAVKEEASAVHEQLHYVDPSLDIMFEKYDRNNFLPIHRLSEMHMQCKWRSLTDPNEGLF